MESSELRTTRGRQRQDDGSVRVWSEVGMTLPVGDSNAYIKFMFGHERIAPDSTLITLKRVTADIDKYNEEEVERRVKKYTRLIMAWESEAEEEEREGTRDRARRKARERVEGKS